MVNEISEWQFAKDRIDQELEDFSAEGLHELLTVIECCNHIKSSEKVMHQDVLGVWDAGRKISE